MADWMESEKSQSREQENSDDGDNAAKGIVTT